MFLKRIELQGFKSFADKSIITFDSDVTGIVGPNGCGKSNINDAIRWVLGEQSVKSLRGGSSMSDIIFSGSAQRKAVNLAEVTLVFDNTRRFFDVAYDEVEITRRLHRQNNEAEYLINKTPCRLKDITDLVMDTGLGRDSLSIITQGNISSFAEAKPEERRALFEEAAGVAKYTKRKNTSLSKLKNTQENLSRLEDIILELERQVNPLRRQAKKADQYLKYKEELSRIEINVIVDEIERLNTQIAEMEKERFELDSRCAMQQTTIQVQDVENEEQRKEIVGEPQNLEEQAISLIGRDIFEKLVKGYTEKQWGRDCKDLPAFIIKRLPVRLTFDNNYFNALYQGIPMGGYTKLIENLLEGIEVRLNTDYLEQKEELHALAEKVVYTGPIDAYFGYKLGTLEYRSVRFETELLDMSNFQGNAAVN